MADTPDFKTSMEFAYGVARDMAPGVQRIVANNPGPFTFKGTNTYLVGTRQLAVIDPGPADPAHLAAILATAAGRPITHVVITHTHRDHTDGMPALLAKTAAKTVGHGRRTKPSAAAPRLAPGGERYAQDFAPDIVLGDGDRLTGDGWTLEAIFTPGHAPDHLCFGLGDAEGAPSGVVFSGDHVMAWNTSVVAPPEGHMGDFMRALEKLMARTDQVYLPGHGGQTREPQRLVKALLMHRRMREAAILDCIRDGRATAADIVPVIYKGLDERLIPAAGLSVLAHVEHLVERGLVRLSGPLDLGSGLSAVSAPAPPPARP